MTRNPIFILPDPKNSKKQRKKQKNMRNSRQVWKNPEKYDRGWADVGHDAACAVLCAHYVGRALAA